VSGAPGALAVVPLAGLGEVRPGDDLAARLGDVLEAAGLPPEDGDILVVTQKVVSKAEGRLVELASVEPSALASGWAERWGKDPRHVEVVLRESSRLVRMDRAVIIAETRHGWVCANAGVDASNVGPGTLALLPVDADASARGLREALQRRFGGARLGVVISDTFGRAWREGQVNVAIGAAGITVLQQYQGRVDPYGYELQVTEIATADELASAAELVMRKTDGIAAVLIRGLGDAVAETDQGARALVRPAEKDMFR
jgi:coenzyme F420-0:L-glutamate ligase/coenzyme F420-1:gamma-L-glutamate ligase